MFVIIQRIQKSNGNCSLLVQQIFTIPGILFSVSTNSKNTHHILKYISSIIFDQFDTKQIGELSGEILILKYSAKICHFYRFLSTDRSSFEEMSEP